MISPVSLVVRPFRKTFWFTDILLLTTAPLFLPVIGYLAYILFRLPYVCILYDLYPDIAIALRVIPKGNWLARLWRGKI